MKPTKPGNHLIDPQRIRALATGVGETQQRSARTGTMRAERVVAAMPPGMLSKSVGYPSPDPMLVDCIRSYPSLDAPLPADGSVGC